MFTVNSDMALLFPFSILLNNLTINSYQSNICLCEVGIVFLVRCSRTLIIKLPSHCCVCLLFHPIGALLVLISSLYGIELLK